MYIEPKTTRNAEIHSIHLSLVLLIMPKLKNPPQGGEKYLCLTMFCAMMLSVMSAVACIYAIVIIYVPSKIVLESKLEVNPIKCTTTSMVQNVVGIENCEGWTSCVEWCLSKVSFEKNLASSFLKSILMSFLV